jgi:hypothetical protein
MKHLKQRTLRWCASAIHDRIGQVRDFLDASFRMVLVLVVRLTLVDP